MTNGPLLAVGIAPPAEPADYMHPKSAEAQVTQGMS
jgi:hypothetical protein